MTDPKPLTDEWFVQWATFYDGVYPTGHNLRFVAAAALEWAADQEWYNSSRDVYAVEADELRDKAKEIRDA